MENFKVKSFTEHKLKVIGQSGQPAAAISTPQGVPKLKLLDQVRQAIRTRHYSYLTEKAYVSWVKRFIFFHNKRHPTEMGEVEIANFLSALARDNHVSSSTQNQALNAVLFLYHEVLGKEIGYVSGVVRAKRPSRLPVVLTRQEVKSILSLLRGSEWILTTLLYGSGLRLMECMRLRVKDIDFSTNQISVRSGKGNKDRLTMLPTSVKEPLRKHLEWTRKDYEKDLEVGTVDVSLPYALERKYPRQPKNGAGSGPSRPQSLTLIVCLVSGRDTIFTNRFYRRPSKMLSERQGYPNSQPATLSGAHLPHTYLRTVTIFAQFRSFWVTRT